MDHRISFTEKILQNLLGIFHRIKHRILKNVTILYTLVIVTHVWSYLVYFYWVPGYIKFLQLKELIVVWAYMQIGVFIEVIIIFQIILSIILTFNLSQYKINNYGIGFTLTAAFMAYIYHFTPYLSKLFSLGLSKFDFVLENLLSLSMQRWITSIEFANGVIYILLIIFGFLTIFFIPRLVHNYRWIKKFLMKIGDESAPLAILLIILDILASGIVLFRNFP